jgi:hypothetical protein
MDQAVKRVNPLWFVALAFVGTLPFDLYYYIVEHFLTAFGIIVIIGKLLFLTLYAQKSRLAWHVGLLLTAAITPLSLLLIHFGSEAGKHPYSRPLFEMAVVLILIVYLWKVRERYFRYVEPRI